jgi:hypothetical protein
MNQEKKEEIIKDIKELYPYLTSKEIINTYIIANKFEDLFEPVTVEYMLPYIFKLANDYNVNEITFSVLETWKEKNYFYKGIERTIEDAIFKIVQEKIIKQMEQIATSILEQQICEFSKAITDKELLQDMKKILALKLVKWLKNSLVAEGVSIVTNIQENKLEIPNMWLKLNNTKTYRIIKREDGSFLVQKI